MKIPNKARRNKKMRQPIGNGFSDAELDASKEMTISELILFLAADFKAAECPLCEDKQGLPCEQKQGLLCPQCTAHAEDIKSLSPENYAAVNKVFSLFLKYAVKGRT